MKFNRPEYLVGITLKVKLAINVYITVNYDEYGIVEVFTQAGQSASETMEKARTNADVRAQAEAVSRLISRSLQQARSIKARKDVLQTMGKTIRGIQGHSGAYNGEGIFIQSVPDAIGWILQGCPDAKGNTTLDTINYPGPKLEIENAEEKT